MNAKDFSIILRRLSEILDSFGDEPLENVLDELDKFSKKRKEKLKPKQKELQVIDDKDDNLNSLIEEIRALPLDKISDFIRSNPNTKSKPQLMALAKWLSISTGSKSTKESLVHAIIKFFERNKLDDIISNKRK